MWVKSTAVNSNAMQGIAPGGHFHEGLRLVTKVQIGFGVVNGLLVGLNIFLIIKRWKKKPEPNQAEPLAK
jgi:hypothetical protein